jgi:hypothetical protein
MRRGLRLAVASIGALVLSVVTGGLTHAQSSGANFNHSLKGTFSFRALDDYYSYEPAVGTLTFDGEGNVSGTMDINVYGTVCTGTTLSGTYTVNSDKLTGTATLTVTNNSTSCKYSSNSALVFPSTGTTVSLVLSLSLVRNGNGVVTLINMAEMDADTTGTFYNTTYSIFGAVGYRTAR